LEKQQPDFHSLFDKLIKNQCSPQEVDQLMDWLNDREQKGALERRVYEELSRHYPAALADQAVKNRLESGLQQILASENESGPLVQRQRGLLVKTWRWAAAAAVLLILITTTWLLLNRRPEPKKEIAAVPVNTHDVQPGKNKAILILGDGRKILLDSAAAGRLALQGNTQVDYKNGQVSYHEGHQQGPGELLYNTLSTANGESYSLTLADGSRVWLNAASSIRFPVAFTGKERRVEITGEVYFKVAKNANLPFIVTASGMDVQALGTEFNINAYSNEPSIKTTLLEGKVSVKSASTDPSAQASLILTPGQQSQLDANNHLTFEKDINVDEIIAWKEGVFHFESADLKTIMRQFARWYNVEIVYEGAVKNRKFFGVVNRNNTLKQVLEMLKDNEIVYSIEGKKLIVKAG
jgi:ferric-dicitrate binding protein FerR (iron transport regulator)